MKRADQIRSYAGFTPSSTYLFSSTLSSALRIYDIHSSKVLKTFRHASYISERFPCPAIIFDRPSTHEPTKANPISNTTTNGTGNGNENENENGDDSVGVEVSSQDGKKRKQTWLVSGSDNGKTVIWDIGNRSVVGILEGHESPIVALAVRPDGKRIATGSLEPEKTIRIWRYDRGVE